MPSGPAEVDMLSRLNRNLGLLQAGSTITIDIKTPAGQKSKFRTTFIGYLPQEYVLIQFPDVSKLGNFSQYITQGTSITVRGLIEGHEGAVVAFVSTVKQSIQIPSRIIVLGFPETVGLQSLRNSIRIDTEIASKILVNNKYWKAMVTDLSINGCQLIVDNTSEEVTSLKGKTIDVIIENFQDQENLKFAAEVCNVKNQLNSTSLGVKFTSASRDAVIKLLLHLITAEAN